jgi:carbonic anhydrase
MKFYKQLGVLASLAVLCGVAGAKSSDEQAIRSVYAKLEHAMKSKSVAGVVALEAPGYTDTEWKHKPMTADKANKKMKEEFKLVKQGFSVLEIKLTSVKVHGAKASATSKYKFVIMNGKHSIEADGTTADSLVKTSKGWQFLSSADTSQKIFQDGKEIAIPTDDE